MQVVQQVGDQRARRRFEIRIDAEDTMRWWTILSVAGVLSAVVLALIGGFPLDMPMPTHSFGWVEPTCGLTRGSTAIARGDFGTAFRYNPLSFLVMAFGAAGVVRVAVGLLTRRWLNISWWPPRYAALVLLPLLVAFTLYQQTNADFIIHSRI